MSCDAKELKELEEAFYGTKEAALSLKAAAITGAASIPDEKGRRVFFKTIYDYKRKDRTLLAKILRNEVDHLTATNPDYRYFDMSETEHGTDGSITYKIDFVLKTLTPLK